MFFYAGCGDPRINLDKSAVMTGLPGPVIPAAYLVGPGDELEIFYYINPGFFLSEYVIDTEDTLRIEFYYYPVLSKTAKVRPDGFITLPRVGDVKAMGLRPVSLAEIIKELYKPFLSYPDVTVELLNFNVKVEKLKTAVTTTSRGQSKLAVVRPDGIISLPYIGEVSASGLTCNGLSIYLEKLYRNFVSNVSITVSVLNARSNRVYIMGQINKPNFYEMSMPITLTQLIAIAGGFTQEANTHQVVVISRSKDGKPEARVFDMDDIIGKGNLNADPFVSQYDVIFVPRTRLAQAALIGDALWRFIPLDFTGSANYSLGGLNE